MALLLSGCATQSNDKLLKGELFYSKKRLQSQNEFEQIISVDEDEIYTFTLFFR